MTVRELLERLAEVPDEAVVLAWADSPSKHGDFREVGAEVTVVELDEMRECYVEHVEGCEAPEHHTVADAVIIG